jgi:AcrR family transcriptional regulator
MGGSLAMDDKTLSRRERERLRRREEMLEAALELFSEKGYHSVSMHEIAEKAEFAIGTLYKFFENKEDLYRSLMLAMAESYHRLLIEALDVEGDVLIGLKRYVAAKAKVFADNVSMVRLYFAETRGASFNIKAGLDADLRAVYENSLQRLASVFETGVREGVFRKMDPYYLAVALDGLTNAFLFCWLEDPEQHPYEKNTPAILDGFLNGVLSK